LKLPVIIEIVMAIAALRYRLQEQLVTCSTSAV